jgi:hypothetical protein
MIDYPEYNGNVDAFTSALTTNLHNSFNNGDFSNSLIHYSLVYNLKPSLTNESLFNCTVSPSFDIQLAPTFQPTNSPIGWLGSSDPSDDAAISTASVVGIVIAVLIVFGFLLAAIYYLLTDLKKDTQFKDTSNNIQLTSLKEKNKNGAKYSSVVSQNSAPGTYVV